MRDAGVQSFKIISGNGLNSIVLITRFDEVSDWGAIVYNKAFVDVG